MLFVKIITCNVAGYFRLWAYLWVHWYRTEEWKLWARSASEEVPVLKTTMIIESHWRSLKQGYLYEFNRPRVDLVVCTWLITSRVLPDSMRKLQVFLEGKTRLGYPSWRKAFKKEWEYLEGKPVDRQKIDQYRTDPVNFVCGFPYYRENRFLICKHLVYCFEPVVDRAALSMTYDGAVLFLTGRAHD